MLTRHRREYALKLLDRHGEVDPLFTNLHLFGGKGRMARMPAGHAGLALWSFMMSMAHGAG